MSKDNLKQHLSHPFYKQAEDYWQSVRTGQIKKGAEKYPEPFTTTSWTNDEIVDHAMQENVDQSHYIYACKERMDEQEKEIVRLREALEFYAKLSNYNYIALVIRNDNGLKARRALEGKQ